MRLDHDAPVRSAMFAPDGGRILTAAGNTARLWDAGTGRLLATLAGHRADLRNAAFSSDGKLIVTTSDDHTARLRDAETGHPLRTFYGHGDLIYSAAFSRDSSLLVTASQDGTARVWDVQTGITRSIFRGHVGSVFAADFSPDSTRVVTASDDETARVWEHPTLDPISMACGVVGNDTDLTDLAQRYGLAGSSRSAAPARRRGSMSPSCVIRLAGKSGCPTLHTISASLTSLLLELCGRHRPHQCRCCAHPSAGSSGRSTYCQ